jgi:hypothetical protein
MAILVLLLFGGIGLTPASAVQRQTLMPTQERKVEVEPGTGTDATGASSAHKVDIHPGEPGQGAASAGGQASGPPGPLGGGETGVHGTPPTPQAPGAKPEKREAASPVPTAESHGPAADTATHAAHGPALPEISSTPGVSFVETMIKLLDHELHGRFLGWRPNDLLVGRFTDNVNHFQLGVLEAMRFTTMRLKDSLTRMGDADAYDRDLESALNLLMNRATLFWFPSAENSYSEAVEHLRRFVHKLQTGQRYFYYRVDNLHSLIVAYKDLLGNVNRSLIMANHADGTPVSWFEIDDYFYYAKGVAHVLYEVLKVVRVGFKAPLETLRANEMMDEILHELHRADTIEPWIILDSDFDSFYANHRANLNAPLSEVAHLLSVMSQL